MIPPFVSEHIQNKKSALSLTFVKLRADIISVVPPVFRSRDLHSADTGHRKPISDTAFPVTVEISVEAYLARAFRFTARRLLPYIPHEDSHQPSSLFASGAYVLLPVNAILPVFVYIIIYPASYIVNKIKRRSGTDALQVVPKAGLEPARYRYRWILSPLRLPIPSLRHIFQTLQNELYNRLSHIVKKSIGDIPQPFTTSLLIVIRNTPCRGVSPYLLLPVLLGPLDNLLPGQALKGVSSGKIDHTDDRGDDYPYSYAEQKTSDMKTSSHDISLIV